MKCCEGEAVRASLAPARRHQEADESDAEADKNVPRGKGRDRKRALADVEDDDPNQSQQHEAEHDGFEPDGIGGITRVALDGTGSL